MSIVECPFQHDRYDNPNAEHLKIWDIPGCGTVTHNTKTYFLDKCLYVYDCLIVVTATRCFDVDLHLIAVADMYGIPTVVVRNKIDDAYDAHARTMRGKSEVEVVADLRPNIEADF